MTRRNGTQGRRYNRSRIMSMGLSNPTLCPPRLGLEEKYGRAVGKKSYQVWVASGKTTSPMSGAVMSPYINHAYSQAYPEGPYPIPSANHPCAKRWLSIQKHYVEGFQMAQAASASTKTKTKAKAKAKSGRRSARTRFGRRKLRRRSR